MRKSHHCCRVSPDAGMASALASGLRTNSLVSFSLYSVNPCWIYLLPRCINCRY